MKCPHCLENFHDKQAQLEDGHIGFDEVGSWDTRAFLCPACNNNIIYLRLNKTHPGGKLTGVISLLLKHPKGHQRPPVPPEIPSDFTEDYTEACQVLQDSPKASAALSRRCLQHILREKAEVKSSDLANEIQQVLDSSQLPTYLGKSIDGVRNIGNFAAHPIKSKNTGEIVPVEPGEAEWNLDTIEGLFDFYFVQPAIMDEKRAKLDDKLHDAGKPSMKQPVEEETE